jgi:signal transduction histidine kinase
VERAGRGWKRAAAWALCLVVPALFFLSLPIDLALHHAGRDDLGGLIELQVIPIVLGLASATIVGLALATRRPDHPVGWLFLGLADSVALSAFSDDYSHYGALVRSPPLPGASIVAVYADASFVPWFVFLALILLLTPTGRPPSPRWRWLTPTIVVSGVVSLLAHLVSTAELEAPLQSVRNPLGIPGLSPVPQLVGFATILVLNIGFLVAAASIVVRFRRARGEERRQLLWVVLIALVLPVVVVASFVAALTEQPALLIVTAGLYIALVPIGCGLAITQYHLYDVDRIVSRATAYVLLSAVVVGVYVAVAVGAGRIVGGVGGDSSVAVALATLAAAAVAGPARRRLQDALDRRFNRRRFDALAVVRAHVRQPDPSRSIEAVLRDALADPALSVSYWIDERSQWATGDGHPLDALGTDAIEVERAGRLVAAVSGPSAAATPELVAAVAAEAAPELESTRLRAAIELQLVEVQQSRARLVTAQLDERKKIERNLHDGAQQRLVALGLYLGMAAGADDLEEMRAAVATAQAEAKAAVQELRELANGLHPAILTNGGLVAAVDSLAGRTPLPIRADVTEERFPPDVEAAAWFITCEAIANAVKHAEAGGIDVRARREGDRLVVVVRDDGRGGVRPEGTGIRGIADRAEAAGGSLAVRSEAGTGTEITAAFPVPVAAP